MTRLELALLTSAALVVTAGVTARAGTPVEGPADPALVQPAPLVSASSDWSGLYYGAGLGLGKFDFGAASSNGRHEGAFIGYDRDYGSFTLGIEGQYHGQNVNVGGMQLNSVSRLKLRAGYDAGPVLVYGVAGYGYADTSAGTSGGYVAGVGVDYRFKNGIAVGAEYLYNDFGTVGGMDLSGNTLEARISYRF